MTLRFIENCSWEEPLKQFEHILTSRRGGGGGEVAHGSTLYHLQCNREDLNVKFLSFFKKFYKIHSVEVFIPRNSLTPSTELPFIFKRRQFPMKLAFAMTINKS
jgi:hypothetical protein